MIYPAHYAMGWNGAKQAILAAHPGLFDPSSAFPCPEDATVLRTLFGQDGDAGMSEAEEEEAPTQVPPSGQAEEEEEGSGSSESEEESGSGEEDD